MEKGSRVVHRSSNITKTASGAAYKTQPSMTGLGLVVIKDGGTIGKKVDVYKAHSIETTDKAPIPTEELDLEQMPRRPDKWSKHEISEGGAIPPMKEGTTAVLMDDGFVYVFGGIGAASMRFNHFYRFDMKNFAWSVVEAHGSTPPAARSGHTATCMADGKTLCIIGGEGEFEGDHCTTNARTSRNVYGDVWTFDTTTKVWHVISALGAPPLKLTPGPRRGHSTTLVHHTKLFVFGGAGPEPVKGRDYYFDETWILDWATKEWTKAETTGPPPPPRAHHSATLVKDRLFIVGGMNSHQSHDDIYQLDVVHKAWSKVEMHNKGPLPLFAHSAHLNPWYPSRVCVYGGKSNALELSDRRLWMLNVETYKWEIRITKGVTPAERFSHLSWIDRRHKQLHIMWGADMEQYKKEGLYTLTMHRPPMKGAYKFKENEDDKAEGGGDVFALIGAAKKWRRNSISNKSGASKAFGRSASLAKLVASTEGHGDHVDAVSDAKGEEEDSSGGLPRTYGEFKYATADTRPPFLKPDEVASDVWGVEWERIREEVESGVISKEEEEAMREKEARKESIGLGDLYGVFVPPPRMLTLSPVRVTSRAGSRFSKEEDTPEESRTIDSLMHRGGGGKSLIGGWGSASQSYSDPSHRGRGSTLATTVTAKSFDMASTSNSVLSRSSTVMSSPIPVSIVSAARYELSSAISAGSRSVAGKGGLSSPSSGFSTQIKWPSSVDTNIKESWSPVSPLNITKRAHRGHVPLVILTTEAPRADTRILKDSLSNPSSPNNGISSLRMNTAFSERVNLSATWPAKGILSP